MLPFFEQYYIKEPDNTQVPEEWEREFKRRLRQALINNIGDEMLKNARINRKDPNITRESMADREIARLTERDIKDAYKHREIYTKDSAFDDFAYWTLF